MFQTQYNWDYYGATNVLNIFSGITLTIFKCLLYGLFIIRMFIVAILIAVAPILILINGFLNISGNKNSFIKWIAKLFIYCVLSRPIIAIIYYLLAKTNVSFIEKNPYFILLPIIIVIILVVWAIRRLGSTYRNSKTKTKKSQQ